MAPPPEVRLNQEPPEQPLVPEPQQPPTRSPNRPPPPKPPVVQPPPQQQQQKGSSGVDMFRDMLSQKKHAILSKLSSIDSEVSFPASSRVQCTAERKRNQWEIPPKTGRPLHFIFRQAHSFFNSMIFFENYLGFQFCFCLQEA